MPQDKNFPIESNATKLELDRLSNRLDYYRRLSVYVSATLLMSILFGSYAVYDVLYSRLVAAQRTSIQQHLERIENIKPNFLSINEELKYINRRLDAVKAATSLSTNSPVTPIGAIIPIFDTSALPHGWLRCDGRTIEASEYPALFSYLESSKDDAGLVRIPDLTSTPAIIIPTRKAGQSNRSVFWCIKAL